MLHRLKEVIGCAITDSAGEVGYIKDIYFDDQTWVLRYYVVQTGTWLNSQEVLLSPVSVTMHDGKQIGFATSLSRQQVKDSPPLASDMPVSRQYEQQLSGYYGWGPYWSTLAYEWPSVYAYPMAGGLGYYPYSDEVAASQEYGSAMASQRESGDPCLRSMKEVRGYGIEATDGKIGHLEDLFLDSDSMRMSHFEVKTRNWLPGKHVVVDIAFVGTINWADEQISLRLSREEVRASPPYDPMMFIDEKYQSAISSYYHHLTQQSPGHRRTVTSSEHHPM
jgi:uncharacterized protein YrrD